ncbi:unnamed protein product [Caenorhabditis angaria]|uniref:Uncharacterized protein n=1 Tax=Caenorhabditis angaria TaxID=860376 RepID=A0A9P1I3C9_9PELO|nr:unnamed protein product [Caenorhabditis angaria]
MSGFPPRHHSQSSAPNTPSAIRRAFPPSPTRFASSTTSAFLPPSPKLGRKPAPPSLPLTPTAVRKFQRPVVTPSSSPQIAKLRINGKVVRVSAIRQSAYYSSSEDEDSLAGGTLGRKTSTITKPPQTTPRTSSLASSSSQPKPATTEIATPGTKRGAAESGAAVEAMLRMVQENRDRHDQQQQKREYGEYVQARIRPKPASSQQNGEIIRVSRQDYRNSKIIVTENEGIRISPHREEFETTIDAICSDPDDEAVYVNTEIRGQTRISTESPDSADYQNSILPLKPAKVSTKIQSVVNALQKSEFFTNSTPAQATQKSAKRCKNGAPCSSKPR